MVCRYSGQTSAVGGRAEAGPGPLRGPGGLRPAGRRGPACTRNALGLVGYMEIVVGCTVLYVICTVLLLVLHCCDWRPDWRCLGKVRIENNV